MGAMDAATAQTAQADAEAKAGTDTMLLLAQKERQLQFHTENYLATLRDLGIVPMHFAIGARVVRLDGKGETTLALAAYEDGLHPTELDEFIEQATRHRALVRAEAEQQARPGDFLYVGSLRKQRSRVLA